jgi:inorganic triphosphatase YgiF
MSKGFPAAAMDVPQEVELKLEVPPASLPRVERARIVRAGQSAPAEERTVTSVYFDTQKFKLRKHGLLLRVRHIGQRRLQTVKQSSPGSSIARGEWEQEIDGDVPDLEAARGTALDPLLTKKLRRTLKPVFATEVRRKTIRLRHRESEIEVSIDRGLLSANGRAVPIAEVELELKSGKAADLFALARGLAKDVPVRPSLISKGERGYRLSEGKIGAPVKARSVALARGMPVVDAFRAIGHACLRQLIGNEPAVREGHSEGVHQARVALRRLRAAIAIFSALLDGPQTEEIKVALKWLAGELAPARDLDVFVGGSLAPMRRETPPKPGVRALGRDLERRRAAAFERAAAVVDSRRYRALLIDLIEWLEVGAWTQSRRRDAAAPRRGSIEDFAAAELARRGRKVAKRSKKLAALDAARRHKLRLAVKKLRYASKFFASLFDSRKRSKRRRAFVKALARMQDCLGDLNDIAVHERLVAEAVAHPRPNGAPKARRSAFAAGVISGREEAHAQDLLRSAVAAGAALARAKPFWT